MDMELLDIGNVDKYFDDFYLLDPSDPSSPTIDKFDMYLNVLESEDATQAEKEEAILNLMYISALIQYNEAFSLGAVSDMPFYKNDLSWRGLFPDPERFDGEKYGMTPEQVENFGKFFENYKSEIEEIWSNYIVYGGEVQDPDRLSLKDLYDYMGAYQAVTKSVLDWYRESVDSFIKESKKDGPIFLAAASLLGANKDMEAGGTLSLNQLDYTFDIDGKKVSLQELLGVEVDATSVNMEKMAELCDILTYGYDPTKNNYRYFNNWEYGEYFKTVDPKSDIYEKVVLPVRSRMNTTYNDDYPGLSFDFNTNTWYLTVGDNQWKVDLDEYDGTTLGLYDALRRGLKKLEAVTGVNGEKTIYELAEEYGVNESIGTLTPDFEKNPLLRYAGMLNPEFLMQGAYESMIDSYFSGEMEKRASLGRGTIAAASATLYALGLGSMAGGPLTLALFTTLAQLGVISNKEEISIGYFVQRGLDRGLDLPEAIELAEIITSCDFDANAIDIILGNSLGYALPFLEYLPGPDWVKTVLGVAVPVGFGAGMKWWEYDVNKDGIIALAALQRGIPLDSETIKYLSGEIDWTEYDLQGTLHGALTGAFSYNISKLASIGAENLATIFGITQTEGENIYAIPFSYPQDYAYYVGQTLADVIVHNKPWEESVDQLLDQLVVDYGEPREQYLPCVDAFQLQCLELLNSPNYVVESNINGLGGV